MYVTQKLITMFLFSSNELFYSIQSNDTLHNRLIEYHTTGIRQLLLIKYHVLE